MRIGRWILVGSVALSPVACGESQRSETGGRGTGGTGGSGPRACGPAGVVCPSGQSCKPLLFRESESALTEMAAARILIADVNEDAELDLVLLGLTFGFGLAFGHGTGAFDPMVLVPTERETYTGRLADFNGDGHWDLALGIGPLSTGVILGNGDGTFQTPRIIDTEASGALAVADVNADGAIDIAMTGVGLRVWLGTGSGEFLVPIETPAGFGPNNLELADVTEDTRPDALISNFDTTTLGLLDGNGDGSFAALRSVATGGAQPGVIRTSDLDRNGTTDVLTVHFDRGMSVLLGTAAGALGPAVSYETGLNPTDLVVADFDGNDVPDIAVANSGLVDGNGSISILLGNGDGTFGPRRDFMVPIGATYVAAADFDGDGRDDLVVSDHFYPAYNLFSSTAEEGCLPP